LPCAPPARGCCPPLARNTPGLTVLPAPAGVIPTPHQHRRAEESALRPRRGDPDATPTSPNGGECSPPARGWSGPDAYPHQSSQMLPAHAGVGILVAPSSGEIGRAHV